MTWKEFKYRKGWFYRSRRKWVHCKVWWWLLASKESNRPELQMNLEGPDAYLSKRFDWDHKDAVYWLMRRIYPMGFAKAFWAARMAAMIAPDDLKFTYRRYEGVP